MVPGAGVDVSWSARSPLNDDRNEVEFEFEPAELSVRWELADEVGDLHEKSRGTFEGLALDDFGE